MNIKEFISKTNPDRIYIVISPTARTDANYPDKGYAGPSGRIDEVARSIMSIVREKSLLAAVLMGPPNPPLTLLYTPRQNCLFSSEREIVQEIRRSVSGRGGCLSAVGVEARDLISILSNKGYSIILLTEKGKDISKLDIQRKGIVFLMGSHVDIPKYIIDEIKRYIAIKASIGPLSYQSSQVIAYLEWEAEACA